MGKIDFNAMARETRSKETAVIPSSDLEKEYNKIWGKKKAGETVEMLDITLLTEFRGKNKRKQPFKINKKKVGELAESINTIGITTPLIVRKKDNGYQILSGHHRFRACQSLGYTEIPCIVRDISDTDAERYVCECNIQRLKLLPSEYGKILERYMDLKDNLDLTVAEVAKKFGISARILYKYVNLSKLSEALQDDIDLGYIYVDLSDGLVTLSEEQQNKLHELIAENTHKTLTVLTGKNVIEMFMQNDIQNITTEMYLECFEKPKKNGYKNKVYNNVYKKYLVPEGEQIDEKELDTLVGDFLDDYFGKRYTRQPEKNENRK